MKEQVDRQIQEIVRWAKSRREILALSLVGSWARGEAHDKSDIDLMFLTEKPLLFREDITWLSEIDWGDRHIEKWEDKNYDAVWSRHVYLHPNDAGYAEVEFSFGQSDWASISPLDSGTRQVVSDGYRVLYDPKGIIIRLVNFVSE